ncbi:MAG TPA: hypothetical protein VL404_02885 [Candidatus Eisenbacteria bacterium]|nr:hypothetical protein [Candidatus Eisenbacteria bacterium]
MAIRACSTCGDKIQEDEGKINDEGAFVCFACAEEARVAEDKSVCTECGESSEEFEEEGICPSCGAEAEKSDDDSEEEDAA